MTRETPIQRVEYLLEQVRREEGRINAARALQDRIRTDSGEVRAAVSTSPGRVRFWFRTKFGGPYASDPVETTFDLGQEDIEVFRTWLDVYMHNRQAAKDRYEDQILHPKEAE